jgi:PAS domain S-box-containing protein
MARMTRTDAAKPKNSPNAGIIAGLVFLGLYFAWLIWGAGNAFERGYAGTLVLVFTGGAAAWQGWRTKDKVESSGLQKAWLWITAGLVVSTTGDMARFLTNSVFNGSNRFAEAGFWLYLIGTLLLAVGISVYPRTLRASASRATLLMDTFITTTAVVVLAWLVVFEPLYGAAGFHLQSWAAMLFPLVDLILLVIVLDLFLLSDPHRVNAPFLWILAGLLAFTLSDLFFVSLVNNQGYQPGSLVDLGWIIGDGCFFLAAVSQLHGKIETTDQQLKSPIARLQKLLPVLLVVILGWYSLFFWQFSGATNSLGLWVTVILGIGLIIRQGISTGEQQFIQYASLVNSISEPAFVCDREGRLRMVNPAFLRITGHNQTQEVLGSRLQRMLDEAIPLPPFSQLRKTGWSGEKDMLTQNGERIPVSLSLQPIQPGGDDRLSLAGTAHDLRELKKQQKDLRSAYEQIASAHDELEKMNQQLAEKVAEETANLSVALNRLEKQNRELQKLDELKSDFVSLVSHELRAPLTNINGGIELVLKEGNKLPVQTKNSLELVSGEINRLTRFVETILDISSLDAGRMPLTIAPLAISRVAATIQRQMTHLEETARITWQIPVPAPEVLADENAMNSILFHLLDNALKYAPSGQITVSAGSKGMRGWLTVTDQGMGIPDGAMPYLFDRFYRYNTEDDREVYGHGMGLYIVKRLLEAMAGSIEVCNLPDAGAQFTCWLPLADTEMVKNEG